MRSEWKQYKISEFADVIGGGTPSTTVEEYYGGNIPWLTPRDMSNYNSKYIGNGSRDITDLGLAKSSARLVPKGTVLFTSRAPIGYIAIAEKEVCTNQGFKSLICNSEIAHNEYIYYVLKSKVSAIESIASGSTFKEVSGSVLKDFKLDLPSLPTQKKIAHILSTLDDKIELNRKMNQTLEEMAQAIFKSWFVDFDPVHAKMTCRNDKELEAVAQKLGISKEVLELFPSEFEESELGMIPEGWEIKELGDFFPVVTGKKNANVATNDGAYTFFTCSQNTSRTDNYSFNASAVLFAGNGDFNVKRYRGKFEAYQRTYVLIPNNDSYLSFLYILMSYFLNDITQGSQGSVIKFITKGMLENYKVKLPNDEKLLKITKIFTDINFNIESNEKQIQTLQKIRDTLLPKLLSGELDVSGLHIGTTDDK